MSFYQLSNSLNESPLLKRLYDSNTSFPVAVWVLNIWKNSPIREIKSSRKFTVEAGRENKSREN